MTGTEDRFMKGKIIATIFHNEENLYTVVRVRIVETNTDYEAKEIVITGYFPKMYEEDIYLFYGDFQEHPRYGLQFQATHYRKELPKTREGVIQYLSGELFKGIGKKTAEAIVDTLGENAISRILEDPDLLDQVPKLSKKKAKNLYETLLEHQGLEKIIIALNGYGFGPQLSMRIYQTYREDTLAVIESNPYQLVEDVEGIGFGRADELGAKLGITGKHPDRLKAASLFTLQQLCLQEGHVYLLREHFIERVKYLLEANRPVEITPEEIEHILLELEEEGKLIAEDERMYIPSLFFAEKGVVTNIKRILKHEQERMQFPESEILLALGEVEEELGIEYAPTQREAIHKAITSPMLILTGGPGTGKTTVIKGIVEVYSRLHGCSLNPNDYKEDPFPFILTAPTGRAAKRMSESTGLPALTIHRLLGWSGAEHFEYNEENRITGKMIIIDEMSMVDVWLANNLLKALPDEIQVIMVGDEDQLPSVGPGQVLKDLLDSGLIPTVQLTDIFRQEDGSTIIQLAHSIKKGIIPKDLTVQQKDRSFIPCSPAHVPHVVKQIVESAIRKGGYTKRDIQVLAPMYRGQAGINHLNRILQEVFNGNSDGKKRELRFGDVTYRVGDKVLQLVNQPDKNIFNGDIGEISAIIYAKENEDKEDQLFVTFDDTEVMYTRQDLQQITLAYCCSIHKSQGSEFPVVILPVVKSYYRMLRRNLIYTAITRSKDKLILCGEVRAFEMAIEREDENLRQTTLKDRLLLAFGERTEPNLQTEIMEEPVENEESYAEKLMKTDPMIGMGDLTPYDFMEEEILE